MQRVVFDSYALLAWLEREPGAEFVEHLLSSAEQGQLWAGVCSINLGEVYYRTWRDHGANRASEHLAMLLMLPWHVFSAADSLVWRAAAVKGQHPVSYADAFAIACAEEHGASIVTNDKEIRTLRRGLKIIWDSEV